MLYLIYFVVKKIAQAIQKLYFRKVHLVGLDNIPNNGPVIICGNHNNQFIDAIMILASVQRNISFTMAASSFNKNVIGFFAKACKAIPVYRPEDSKKLGKGLVNVVSNSVIKGNKDTDFIIDGITNDWSIMIQDKIFKICKVIDKNTLSVIINKEFNNLLGQTDLKYFLIPKTDNSQLFKDVYKRLQNNGCICIFPEGTSHDRTDFIKLKAGIALMALGAMNEELCKNIKIVPVGLNYFKREEFRSEVIIEFGTAFEVPQEWAREFKTKKRESTDKLLGEIEGRMKAVTLTADSYIELRTLHLLRKMHIPKETKLSPTQYSELCKQFNKAIKLIKEKNDSCKILTRVNNYVREIEEIAITDTDIKDINFEQKKMKRKFLFSTFMFFFSVLILFPGLLVMLPFIIYISSKAEKERLAVSA